MKPKTFKDLYQEAEKSDDYWVAGVVLELTEAVVEIMDREGITRSELANRLGTSPAYVTKILRGNANFTLATMVRLARALGADLSVQMVKTGSSERLPKEPQKYKTGRREQRLGLAAAASHR